MGPEGEKAANELEQLFNKVIAKSGGTFTGGVGHKKAVREPDSKADEFVIFTRENNGILQLVAKAPDGAITILAP